MTTLDQIIAETAEYARLKAASTQGDWRRVDYDDEYDGTDQCYIGMKKGEYGWSVDSSILTFEDADFIVAAHNMLIEQYITALVNRVKRLEDALSNMQMEHHERCRVFRYHNHECNCDAAETNEFIERVLNEGLK